MIELKEDAEAVYLPVKAVPGASRTRGMGVLDARLKIAVAAPPEKGKANAELAAFLAGRLGVRRRDVTVERGHGSALKLIRIANTTPAHIRAALDIPDANADTKT